MNEKKLYRSRKDRVIFGVCGGLGKYFSIDPLIIRLVFLALLFGGGAGLIIYLLAALLIPSDPSEDDLPIVENLGEGDSGAKKKTKDNDWSLFFGLVLIIAGLSILLARFWPFSFIFVNFWPLLLILLGLLIIFKSK